MNLSRFNGASALPFILAAVAALMGCIMIAVVGWFVFGTGQLRQAEVPTPTPRPVSTASVPTATASPSPTETPTATVATVEATATEAPTGAPTATTVPATNPPATNAPPRPTNTPVPPTATPAPADDRLKNVSFSVENTNVAANERIWFNFSVTNNSPTQLLPFGYLGAAVFNSAGQNVYFQASWSGSELQPGQTLNWRDGVAIGTPGTYSLQLSICYSSKDVCNSGGEWKLLASPVPVTVR